MGYFMKNINKNDITSFLNTKEGKKYMLVGIVAFFLGMLWKTVMIILLMVVIGYFIYKRKKKSESKKW